MSKLLMASAKHFYGNNPIKIEQRSTRHLNLYSKLLCAAYGAIHTYD